MAHDMRIVVACPDRTGVLAAIASRLYDLGADFGDTSFAVLGEAAEFVAICRLPDDFDAQEVERQLSLVPELAAAAISISPFTLGAYILNLTGGNPALASVGTNVTQRPMTGKTTLRRPHCN